MRLQSWWNVTEWSHQCCSSENWITNAFWLTTSHDGRLLSSNLMASHAKIILTAWITGDGSFVIRKRETPSLTLMGDIRSDDSKDHQRHFCEGSIRSRASLGNQRCFGDEKILWSPSYWRLPSWGKSSTSKHNFRRAVVANETDFRSEGKGFEFRN